MTMEEEKRKKKGGRWEGINRHEKPGGKNQPACILLAQSKHDGRGKKKFSTLEKGNMNYCLSPSTKSSASALLTTTTALLFRSYLTP